MLRQCGSEPEADEEGAKLGDSRDAFSFCLSLSKSRHIPVPWLHFL